MSHTNGAYGPSDATNTTDNATTADSLDTVEKAGSSTDEELDAHAKSPRKKPKSWLWVLIAALAIIAIIVTAVVVKTSGKRSATSGTAASAVTVGLTLAPTNLDIRNQSGSALDQVLIGNVYEGLVARDSKNQVVPALAASWDVSVDGTTYTFHLHDGITFSNGDVLDAEDVAWSINELVDKQYQDASSLVNFASVRAIDKQTVRITLSAPYANLLWVLTGRPGLVLDKDAQYDAKTAAVGSGPYTVAKFAANDSITLQSNTRYWGKNAAKTPTVIVRYFADNNAAVNALKSGDAQVLAPITENLTAPLRKDPDRYVVKTGDDTDKFVLAFNSKGAKTSDKRVRQAIRYAIDHQAIIASRGGADTALGGPIPSLDPGYEDLTGLYPHDVDKAKALLAEAGYGPSHPLEVSLTYANIYGTELGDQLRSQLNEVGIKLTVKVVEFSTWLQDVYTNKNYDLSLVDHNESHDFASWTDPSYYYNYDNEAVRELYQQAIASTDAKQSEAYLAQAARKVSEDAAADWLFNYRVTTAYAKGVSGFPVNLNQTVMPLYRLAYTPV